MGPQRPLKLDQSGHQSFGATILSQWIKTLADVGCQAQLLASKPRTLIIMKKMPHKFSRFFRNMRIVLFPALLLGAPSLACAQDIVFTENIGIPSGTTAITTYATGTSPATFENAGTLTYDQGGAASPADVRNTSASTGYPGASGAGNIFFTTTAGERGFAIGSIAASGLTGMQLTYGYRKESGTALASFSVDYWNGTEWVTIANTAGELFNEAANAPTGWYLAKTLNLPTGAQIDGLQIRFVKSGSLSIRIDDIKLTAASSSPTITPLAQFPAFSSFVGSASTSSALSVAGANLTAAITATAPAGFDVSADNIMFGATASLPAAGGTLYARVSAAAPVGESLANITLSSDGATSVAVPVSASVRPTSLVLPYGPDNFETTSFPWYSYTVAGVENWVRTSADGNFFMQFNGFSNGVPSNAWLILGPFDVPAEANSLVATFSMQKTFSGPESELELVFSTDYSGLGDPSSANWSIVPFDKPQTGAPMGAVGAVQLPSSLLGASGVYVAFRVQSPGIGVENTSRWRMDNFELFASDKPLLSVTVTPGTIDEGGTGVGTVVVPEGWDQDVLVTVTSADPSVLLVNGEASTQVFIEASFGFRDAFFDVTTARDWLPGPNVEVQITAEDEDEEFEFGQTLVVVRNIDVVSADLTSAGYTQTFGTFADAATLPVGWSVAAPSTVYSGWRTATVGVKHSVIGEGGLVFGYQHATTGTTVQTLTLRNMTEEPITELTVSYLGRSYAASAETSNPSYTVRIDGVPVGALNYSTAEGDNVRRTLSITGLDVAPGTYFQISWSSNGASVTGSGTTRKQIGISDVSVSLQATPLPPAVGSLFVWPFTLGNTTAGVQAEVFDDGLVGVQERGFVFAVASVNSNPTIGGIGVTKVENSEAVVGLMTATLDGLTPQTTYAVRAYAINGEGTAYTSAQTFTTVTAASSFSGVYSQTFNNYTGAFPVGWHAVSSGTTDAPLGLQAYAGAWGSGTGAGFRGGTSNPGVLGYQHTAATGLLRATAYLVNDTGEPITQLNVSYLGRVARPTETRTPVWTVSVAGTEVEALTYSTGNTAGPDGAPTDLPVSALVTGLNIAPGEQFTISWVSDRGFTTTGSSRQIGLASVVISSAPPSLEVSSNLVAFSTTVGAPSEAQIFTASGSNLLGNVTVSAPTGFQVSQDGISYGSSTALVPVDGTLGLTTLRVRLTGADVGSFSGDITLSSSGLNTQTIPVSGTVSGGGQTFADWADGAPLDQTNLLKYAIGGASSPTATNGVAPVIGITTTDLTLTAIVRTNDPNLTTVGTAITNLSGGTWSTLGVTMTPAADQSNVPEGCERQIFSTPRGVDGKKFLRLQSTLSEQ
jgi:hypothetical protein